MYYHIYYNAIYMCYEYYSTRVNYICQPHKNIYKTNIHIKLKRIDATC